MNDTSWRFHRYCARVQINLPILCKNVFEFLINFCIIVISLHSDVATWWLGNIPMKYYSDRYEKLKEMENLGLILHFFRKKIVHIKMYIIFLNIITLISNNATGGLILPSSITALLRLLEQTHAAWILACYRLNYCKKNVLNRILKLCKIYKYLGFKLLKNIIKCC